MVRAAPPVTALLFFVLYAATAAPSIVTFFDDTLEFQLVLPSFGIAHPTGYPLYTILGGLWSRLLPLGEWAGRVNLFSALCAAMAVGLLCALAQAFVRTTLPRARGSAPRARGSAPQAALWGELAAGVAAALAFGLGPTWRAMAGVAEVYALHGLFVALILLLTLRAATLPSAHTARAHTARAVTWVALAVGLGLAHHRTTLLLLPALAVYLIWVAPGLLRPQRAWLLWAGALLAPLLLYLWLPLRYAMGVRDLNAAYQPGWQGFWNHVLARAYSAFFAETPLAVARTPADWAALAVRELGWVALALALLGAAAGLALALRTAVQPRATGAPHTSAPLQAWTLLLGVAAANLIFALNYRVGDVEVFLLPVWLCAAAAAGVGVALLMQGAAGATRRPALAPAVGALLLLLLLPGWDGRGAAPSRRHDWAAHDAALALTAGNLPVGSQVVGLEGEITALRYMQQALGRAPGVTGVVADDPARRLAAVEAAMASGAPLWLTRELPGIESSYSFSADGALVRVWPRGQAQPALPTVALQQPFAGGALTLVGYDLAPLLGAEARQLRLGLHWLPSAPLTQTLKLSLRVVAGDDAERVLLLADGAPAQVDLYPLRLVAPTPSWLPGERIRDELQVTLPPASADLAGAQLLLIVYDEATLQEAGRVLIPLPSS